MNSHRLLSGLLGTSVQGGLVVVAVLAVQAVLGRRLKPRWRCLLWLVVVLRLLLPASVGVRWSVFNAPGLRDWLRGVRTTSVVVMSPPARPTAIRVAPSELPLPEERTATMVPAPPQAAPAENSKPAARAASLSLFEVAAWLWAAGLAAILAQVAGRSVRWRREFQGATVVSDQTVIELVREAAAEIGIGRPPPVFESGASSAPLLYGIARPRLVLPLDFASQYSREEIRFIVFHELIHLKRHDLLVNGLATALQAIHWFNPLIWLGFSRLRLDRELACDAGVLERLGAVRRRRYGETIIRLMEGRRLQPLVAGHLGVVEAPAHLQLRIAMITDFEPATRLSVLGLLLVACVGAVCLTDAPRRLNLSVADRTLAAALSGEGLAVPIPLSFASQPLTAEGEPVPAYESIMGRQTFDGLPFNIGGRAKLFGSFAEDRASGNRRMKFSVAVGAAFSELHLIHASTWSADPDGTPIAVVRLLYSDGGRRDFAISYGVQLRDQLRTDYEPDETLSDPDSKLIFRGPGIPSIPGSSLRLFKSMFRNPRPGVPVKSIEFISTGNQSCYELVAATVAGTDAGRPVTPALPLQRPALVPDASLRIRVVDKNSGRPLVGFSVTVTPVPTRQWNATGLHVAADGPAIYRYASARHVQYDVQATCSGYVAVQRKWDPQSGNQLTLALEPGTKLQGRVIDPSGKPVADAEVVDGFADGRLWHAQKVMSDESGAFWFDGLPKGGNLLVISAPGFAPMCRSINADGSVRDVERVASGRIVRGRIVDMSGRGIARARVQFAHGEGGTGVVRLISHTARWAAMTDKDGRFHWNNAPLGPLYLNVVKNGYMNLHEVAYPEGTGVLTLVPPLAVHGSVLDAATGRPIVDFQLRVGRRDPGGPPDWFPGVQDFDRSDGSYAYSIDQPPIFAAAYVFGIQAPGYRPFVSKPIDYRLGAVPLEVSLSRMP